MGLGKTLSLLSLIAATKKSSSDLKVDSPVKEGEIILMFVQWSLNYKTAAFKDHLTNAPMVLQYVLKDHLSFPTKDHPFWSKVITCLQRPLPQQSYGLFAMHKCMY